MSAVAPPTVHIGSRLVDVPCELFEALEAPRAVNLIPVEDQTFFLCPADKPWQKYSWLVKRFLRRWWGPPREGIVAAFPLSRAGRTRLRLLDPSSYLDKFRLKGEFRVANYHPLYYLMPAESGTVPHSHELFWRQIKAYHEHLEISNQGAGAHQVSKWLADEIAATGARSVLELGCGAGRNLHYLSQAIPGVQLHGVEINTEAAARATRIAGQGQIRIGSVNDHSLWQDIRADVAFTSGFLMHLPASIATGVVKRLHAQARLAVFHFELHGPAHSFDYHRYPRDYQKLYTELNLGTQLRYEVFSTSDYRSTGLGHFNHALLVSRK
jgi:hypothetical protein